MFLHSFVRLKQIFDVNTKIQVQISYNPHFKTFLDSRYKTPVPKANFKWGSLLTCMEYMYSMPLLCKIIYFQHFLPFIFGIILSCVVLFYEIA
jgi:hypothetical protein